MYINYVGDRKLKGLNAKFEIGSRGYDPTDNKILRMIFQTTFKDDFLEFYLHQWLN